VTKLKDHKQIVYLFGYSPRNGFQLENLTKIIKEQPDVEIKVILIHDGVIGSSIKGSIPQSLENLLNLKIDVYGMIPDLNARDIDPKTVDKRIITIEYDDLVDILAHIPNIVSWM